MNYDAPTHWGGTVVPKKKLHGEDKVYEDKVYEDLHCATGFISLLFLSLRWAGSSVGISTGYGMDSPGIEFW